ncbi:MAG: ABC transporter substrate-binding protein [Candidatus Eremiobacteraeota bacterium]|nr:ABC transporter substrate-binding protein [Candidatus Eremiobacteraeota bacterium]
MKNRAICALLILLPTACSAGSSTSATSSGSSASSAAQLVEARVKDAVSLDPATAVEGLSLNITSEILENLVRFKPGSFHVEPQIARSWRMTPDGKRWTFSLRPGLKFSDGTALDAQAVKFNFDRWRLVGNPYHRNGVYAYYADMFGGFPGNIADVIVKDPTHVAFVLKRPQGPFLRNVAMPSFAIGSPAAIRDDPDAYALKPIGSGPYTVAEWVKDDHITLQTNPRFEGRRPAYNRIVIRDIPDPATSVLSLQKGDVDILTDPRPDDAAALSNQRGITIYHQPSNNNLYVAMNMDKKPFDNLKVRQAVAYAINIRALVKGFYASGATVANNWTPPGMLGENPSVKAYSYDPLKAKTLLKAAGMARGFATQLYYPTAPRPYMPEPQRIAEAIQADLKKVGIELLLQPLEFGVFLQKVQNGEHPMCLIGWTGDNGDPDNFFYPLLDQDSAHKPNAQNYAFWRDPNFHKLMVEGQTSIDESVRARIYRQANAMVHDRAPAIPIVHTTVPVALRSSIAGYIPRPDSIINFELLKPGPGR